MICDGHQIHREVHFLTEHLHKMSFQNLQALVLLSQHQDQNIFLVILRMSFQKPQALVLSRHYQCQNLREKIH